MNRLFERLINYSQSDQMAAVLHAQSALLEILAHYIDRSSVRTRKRKHEEGGSLKTLLVG